MEHEDKPFIIRTYGKGELAQLYRVSIGTLHSKFLDAGINTGHSKVIWPKDLLKFLDIYGPPNGYYYSSH